MQKETFVTTSPQRLPQIGDSAPPISLPDLQGQQIDMSIETGPLALVFMRHLA